MGLQKTKMHTHHFHMQLFNYFFLLQPHISCIENSIKKLELRTNQQIAEPVQQPINTMVESVLCMNPGDGETSYAKNSFLQVSLSLSLSLSNT